MQRYVIETQEGKKSRSFGATCLGIITANGLSDKAGNTIRPVWALFAGTETELKPFIANLRLGHKASPHNHRGGDDNRLEFLKGARYQAFWQKEAEGAVVTIHHPELFRLDPGMTDPEGLRFILLVPEDWAASQEGLEPSAVEYVQELKNWLDWQHKLTQEQLEALVPTAYLFAAYLDRRTHMPLITDGRFYLQILVSALNCGIASLPGSDIKYNRSAWGEWGIHSAHAFNISNGSYYDDVVKKLGFRHAISVRCSQTALEAFLKEEVRLFFEVTQQAGFFRPILQFINLD